MVPLAATDCLLSKSASIASQPAAKPTDQPVKNQANADLEDSE